MRKFGTKEVYNDVDNVLMEIEKIYQMSIYRVKIVRKGIKH
jgi:hypothetical protein